MVKIWLSIFVVMFFDKYIKLIILICVSKSKMTIKIKWKKHILKCCGLVEQRQQMLDNVVQSFNYLSHSFNCLYQIKK